VAKTLTSSHKKSDKLDVLWETHNNILEEFNDYQYQMDQAKEQIKPKPKSFLDLKTLITHNMMKNCGFCERNCGVNRLEGEKGFCGADHNFSLFSAFPHLGEEPELVPSGTVFTGGCSIRCMHCQNWDISQWRSQGTNLEPKSMARVVKKLYDQGCLNLNMVGGDPTPVTWQWLETMKYFNQNIATIWNSNSYYSKEVALILSGFIDLYLLDFKYGNNNCAMEISEAPRYWEAATRNHLIANKYGELIIRVLVLPGHNDCCTKPILQWIYDNLGPWTRVNLMFQYRPEWRANERSELQKRLSSQEISEANKIARETGLKNLVRG
jgi:putative pyruvate formate lyase activating enzyme